MKNSTKNWSVYLLLCSDNTYYCGITNNVEKRVNTHNLKKGAKYTKGRTPVKLIAVKENLTKSDALKFEKLVKKTKKCNKLKIFS